MYNENYIIDHKGLYNWTQIIYSTSILNVIMFGMEKISKDIIQKYQILRYELEMYIFCHITKYRGCFIIKYKRLL